ncbi:MAG TPA: phosphatase PAP2 family protein [Candidatus Polarisedimenticolia bacterium]|nr:phosphatase PAP2 family protein [Candidatus Polarisedimenticolia bacterium]
MARRSALLFLILSLGAAAVTPAAGAETGDGGATGAPDQETPAPSKSFAEAFGTFLADGHYLVSFPSRATARGIGLSAVFVVGTGLLIHRDDQIRGEAREASGPNAQRISRRLSVLGSEPIEAAGLGIFYAAARGAKSVRAVSTASTAFEAYLWSSLLTSAAKRAFGRTRPSGEADAHGFFDGGSIFPSGHTSRSFAIAAVLSKSYGRKAAFIAYPLAALIGISTIERDVHWASDVFAGAGLGLAVGHGIASRHALGEDASPDLGPRLAWRLAPAPGGAALTLSY